ncbi:36877_t:CDS:2 [Racocetra persica]|uniref:36877_t:CDS:1 n=1 Tax=Racocetra persica TaxID=160502 RepID=A0ACA9KVM2_9GLOM|nr:36877_t:CDS:2 [Racocetra persica]
MPRQKRIKKKPSPYSIKQKDNFNTLPNELFLLIFLFLIPNDITKFSKYKLNDQRFIDFQKTKFINQQFLWFYRYYFSQYGTKYCLIQKYNQLYYPPKCYKWNIRYCNIHTWIEVEDDENNQSTRHILRYADRYADFGKLYCMSRGDILLFIKSDKVDGYGKKTCDICKSFTYCAKCSYEFRRDDVLELRDKLKTVQSEYTIGGGYIVYFMPKTKLKYYAVRKGRKPGIYLTWDECKSQVKGFSDARYQSFEIKTDAENFINNKKETVVLDKNKIQIWTDGCCLGNGTKEARAGIGVFYGVKDPKNLSERLPGEQQTNNRAEIYAVIRVIKKWIEKWEKNGYMTSSNQPVRNQDLIRKLKKLIDSRIGSVKLTHVRGHKGNYGNEQADKLSKIGSLKDEIIEKDEKVIYRNTIDFLL